MYGLPCIRPEGRPAARQGGDDPVELKRLAGDPAGGIVLAGTHVRATWEPAGVALEVTSAPFAAGVVARFAPAP